LEELYDENSSDWMKSSSSQIVKKLSHREGEGEREMDIA